MIYTGIDPGQDGAVGSVFPDGVVEIVDVPLFVAKGKKSYDVGGMVTILRRLADLARHSTGAGLTVAIEKVHSMPKQGVASSFTFGKGYGIWLGILSALEIRHVLVTPQRWQGKVLAGVAKDSPAEEAAVAARLYPQASPHLRGPKGGLREGRVDAVLLAHYGLTENI